MRITKENLRKIIREELTEKDVKEIPMEKWENELMTFLKGFNEKAKKYWVGKKVIITNRKGSVTGTISDCWFEPGRFGEGDSFAKLELNDGQYLDDDSLEALSDPQRKRAKSATIDPDTVIKILG